MSKLTEKEVLNISLEVLNNLQNKAEIQTWVIKYNDKILILPSGKSSWRRKNHATSAFTNSICGLFYKYGGGWGPGEVTKLLIEKKIIKIEQLL